MKPGLDPPRARVQRVTPALPEQPEAAPGDQFRSRPPRAPGLGSGARSQDGSPTSTSHTAFRGSGMPTSIRWRGPTCPERDRWRAGTSEAGRRSSTRRTWRPPSRRRSSSDGSSREIGLEVELKGIPLHIASAAYLEKLAARGEPWDIALLLWTPNIPDPYAYLNQLLDNAAPRRLHDHTLPGRHREPRASARSRTLPGAGAFQGVRQARRPARARVRAAGGSERDPRGDARLRPSRPAVHRATSRSRPSGRLPQRLTALTPG